MYRCSKKQKPTESRPFQGNMTGLKNNEDKLLNLKIMSNCKIHDSPIFKLEKIISSFLLV